MSHKTVTLPHHALRQGHWAVWEYRDQISRQVSFAKLKFGQWFTINELRAKAEELVWLYSEGTPGLPNDSGNLWDWEASANGDPERVKRYVNQALKGDLHNWADSEVRKVKNRKEESLEAWLAKEPDEHLPEHKRIWNEAPYQPELSDEILFMVAEDDRIPFRVSGCEKTRNGLGPYKGHCPFCDAKIRNRGDDFERRYRNYSGGVTIDDLGIGKEISLPTWGNVDVTESLPRDPRFSLFSCGEY